MSYQLSYSSLSVFKECPRCFYYDRKLKLPRPQGIKSGMPTAVDNIIKDRLDSFRAEGMLPMGIETDARLKGFSLYDGVHMKKMRHWKSNPLKMLDSDGNTIVGAFDDLLYCRDTETYAYLDYKSTGKEPDDLFGAKYYQSQCDIYTRFLIEGGLNAADFGVLLFFWPAPDEGEGLIRFKSKAVFLKPNPDDAVMTFQKAVSCLNSNTTPPSGDNCEYCRFVAGRA